MLASKPSESASVKNAYKRRKVCSRSSSRCSARKWVWTKNYRTARLLRQHWAKLEHGGYSIHIGTYLRNHLWSPVCVCGLARVGCSISSFAPNICLDEKLWDRLHPQEKGKMGIAGVDFAAHPQAARQGPEGWV